MLSQFTFYVIIVTVGSPPAIFPSVFSMSHFWFVPLFLVLTRCFLVDHSSSFVQVVTIFLSDFLSGCSRSYFYMHFNVLNLLYINNLIPV